MAGTARLEFAVTVAVLGVIAALALDHIAQLQTSAHAARLATLAAQARSVAALDQARCAPRISASAPLPDRLTPPLTLTTQAPRTGMAPRVDSPVSSCP